MSVNRNDVSKLGKFSRTGAGAVRIPATIARTGVQVYPEQGLREYRPESEVFSDASLATLGSVPVTLNHPPVGVSPTNFREHSIGHVSDAPPEARVKVDGSSEQWLRAQLVVSDGAALGTIDAGGAGEVSCGYSCDLEMIAGVTDAGEPYDAIQRNIRFNHVAILASDQKARAGADAKLRLDNQGKTMKIIVIDGVEYELGSEKHLAKINSDHQKALDASKAALDAQTARADGLQAKLDAATARADSAVASVDAAVEARFALMQRAAKFLPANYDTAGKSNAQVRIDALTAAKIDLTGKSEAYVEARFDALTDANAPAAWVKPDPAAAPAVKADAANINDSDEAFRASLAQKVSK